jgi:acyl-coenzyme A thioesterase PaaI-like protein
MNDASPAAIPPGYERITVHVPFLELLGPFYRRLDAEVEWVGLRVEPRHCNLQAIAHGGLTAALSDIVAGRTVFFAAGGRQPTLTITLHNEFHGKAPLGCWLAARGQLERKGSSVAFSSVELFADDARIGRASAVFKLLKNAKPIA